MQNSKFFTKAMLPVFILLLTVSVLAGNNIPGMAPLSSGDHHTAPPPSIASLNPTVTEIGHITLSMDGAGFNEGTGTLDIDKPAGATVRGAYFMSATTGFSGYSLIPGDVKIDGVDVVWGMSLANAISSNNFFADVTGMVQAKLDGAPAGLVSFEITEVPTFSIDGEVMAVIFNDPNVTNDVTVVLLFGAQAIAGDDFFIGTEPLEISDPTSIVQMSLGISYGYQTPSVNNQVSIIDVNGTRLTSSAGGMDDGQPANGALITVGGLGDSPDNPADPNSPPTDFNYDDELYNLKPLLNDGDIQITVHTQNPSNDDNMFFGAFYITGAAIVGEGAVLSPSFASNPLGTMHTVTASLQDNLGNPVAERTVNFFVRGAHDGVSGSSVTDVSGQADFSYMGSIAGLDTISANFLNAAGELQWAANEAVKEWTGEGGESGDIAGTVTGDGNPLLGVEINLFDGSDMLLFTAYTDASGDYLFAGMPFGNYCVEAVTPLGFGPDYSCVEINHNSALTTVDFEFFDITSGEFENIGWWRWQFNEIRLNREFRAEFTREDAEGYAQDLFDHFYDRDDDHAIQIFGVTFGGEDEPLTFDEMFNTLRGMSNNHGYADKVNPFVLVNLLNIVSGRMSQNHIVSTDGATASQAVTYLVQFIFSDDPMVVAKAYYGFWYMQMGIMIPAGMIPLDTPNIMYKDESGLANLPVEFAVLQNYPNPFNAQTTISFSLTNPGNVSLEVYDILGNRIDQVTKGHLEAGEHSYIWDAGTKSSGTYFYRLTQDNQSRVGRMTLLK